MKTVAVIILILVVIFFGYQLYKFFQQNSSLKDTIAKLNKRIEGFSKENSQLKSDIEYFSKPENLEKELRSKLNLKNPDETLIIVVPPKATSTQ